MSWAIERFIGDMLSKLPAQFLAKLDSNFAAIVNRSPYIPLIERDLVDASAAAVSKYLPNGNTTEHDFLYVKIDSSVNAVTLYPAVGSGQTIEGAASLALAAQYDSAYLVFDRANQTWIAV